MRRESRLARTDESRIDESRTDESRTDESCTDERARALRAAGPHPEPRTEIPFLTDLASIVLPVFALMAIGYAAARFGLLDRRAGDGLSEFVFTIATPALVLRTMMGATLPAQQPWGYWAAYFLGVAIVWAISMLVARKVFAADYPQSVVAGFAAGQANTVLVGIPLILEAYGEAGAIVAKSGT